MKRLNEKVILLAGAGGIGTGLALRYASEGAKLVIADINPQAASVLTDAVNNQGGRAIAVTMDGADESSATAAVASCVSQFGGLDGLHANFASMADSDPTLGVADLPLAVFDELQRVNARGFFVCTRAAVPEMLKRGGGSIVYTSSAAAYNAGSGQVAYAMSKAAIHALMRHVANRYGSEGIRANAIAPALTFDEAIEPHLPQELIDWAKAGAAIKSRIGRPSDIAALGALLLSDEGAYVTGQVINADGGTIMRA